MSLKCTFSIAKQEHVDELRELFNTVRRSYKDDSLSYFFLLNVQDLIRRRRVFIAVIDSQIVGCCAIKGTKVLKISSLFVNPLYSRNHIAKNLLKFSISFFKTDFF